MARISIIIPVYNATEFIARCLDSIIAQSYGDWEAICADDGSTDGCGEILDRYASADRRFKVIHKANGGVSSARNEALKLVSGEYMTFIDSDDFIHPQALEIGIRTAEKYQADLVAYTYDRSYRTWTTLRHVLHIKEAEKVRFRKYDPEKVECVQTDDIFSHVTEFSNGETAGGGDRRFAVKHCQPWRCLYRSSAVSGIRFIEGIIYEDFPWWGEVLLNTGKAAIVNLPLYFYYPNRGSYINSARQAFRIESLRIAIDAAEKVYLDAGQRQKEVWEKYFLVPFREKLESKVRRYGNP